MTREQFTTGTEFTIGQTNFFRLSQDQRTIEKIYRSSDKTRIILEDYHMNVEKIGRVEFEAYTYMLGKKVVRKIKFADLQLFQG
jgi:hypothetical protein